MIKPVLEVKGLTEGLQEQMDKAQKLANLIEEKVILFKNGEIAAADSTLAADIHRMGVPIAALLRPERT